jgi:hypothetical protein
MGACSRLLRRSNSDPRQSIARHCSHSPECFVALQAHAPRVSLTAYREVKIINLDFSNISVHRGRESEKDVVLQQFL